MADQGFHIGRGENRPYDNFLKICYKNSREKFFFHYFQRFLSGFFFKTYIKLQNKGEHTKLIIKNLLEKIYFAAFFFRAGPA